MIKINDSLLEKLLRLSALQISSKEEKEKLKKYLKETLSHFEKIKSIDTKGIQPLVSPVSFPLKMREDSLKSFPDTESILKQAPDREGSLVKAPPAVS